jgi:hypothetical protein
VNLFSSWICLLFHFSRVRQRSFSALSQPFPFVQTSRPDGLTNTLCLYAVLCLVLAMRSDWNAMNWKKSMGDGRTIRGGAFHNHDKLILVSRFLLLRLSNSFTSRSCK